MSNFSKKWENFWYYYKIHVIVGICIAIVAGVTIYDKITYIEDDFLIDCFTDNTYINYDVAEAMAEEIANDEFFDDLNGDGHKKMSISVFSAGADDKTTGMQGGSAYELMNVKMAVGNAAMIFADKSVLKRFEKQGIFQDLGPISQSLGMSDENLYILPDGSVAGIKLDSAYIHLGKSLNGSSKERT